MKQCDSCQSKVIFKIETPTLLNKVSVTLQDVIFGSVWIYFWYRITSFSTDFIVTLQEGESSWLSTFAIKHVCQSMHFHILYRSFLWNCISCNSTPVVDELVWQNKMLILFMPVNMNLESNKWGHPKSWSCFFPKIPTFCHRIDQT